MAIKSFKSRRISV